MGGSTDRTLWQRIRSFFTGLTGFITAAAALIVAVIGALTAVGVIGGGNSGSSPSAITTTTQSWVAQANEICARANDTVAALPQAPKGISMEEAATFVKSSTSIGHRMVRDLTALTPPRGKEQEVAKLLSLGTEVNNNLEEFVADLTLGDVVGLQKRAVTLQRVNKEFNQAAVDLGATTCAEGGSVSDFPFAAGGYRSDQNAQRGVGRAAAGEQTGREMQVDVAAHREQECVLKAEAGSTQLFPAPAQDSFVLGLGRVVGVDQGGNCCTHRDAPWPEGKMSTLPPAGPTFSGRPPPHRGRPCLSPAHTASEQARGVLRAAGNYTDHPSGGSSPRFTFTHKGHDTRPSGDEIERTAWRPQPCKRDCEAAGAAARRFQSPLSIESKTPRSAGAASRTIDHAVTAAEIGAGAP
jgi:hypothetical protein